MEDNNCITRDNDCSLDILERLRRLENEVYTSELNKFIEAQEIDYELALREIKNGKKESHWIWYIFPQLKGLGKSENSERYGLHGIADAEVYYNHELLGARLKEITTVLLNLDNNNIYEIMSDIDALKLQSSMTLFYKATNDELFKNVLDKYYGGKMDENTLSKID